MFCLFQQSTRRPAFPREPKQSVTDRIVRVPSATNVPRADLAQRVVREHLLRVGRRLQIEITIWVNVIISQQLLEYADLLKAEGRLTVAHRASIDDEALTHDVKC